LGKCTPSKQNIELKSEDLIYVKLFRIPEAQPDAVKKHNEEILKLGVVRPLRSKFNSPIFIGCRQEGQRNGDHSRRVA
jgi:hypothetical protein